jgi:hypothetical protein
MTLLGIMMDMMTLVARVVRIKMEGLVSALETPTALTLTTSVKERMLRATTPPKPAKSSLIIPMEKMRTRMTTMKTEPTKSMKRITTMTTAAKSMEIITMMGPKKLMKTTMITITESMKTTMITIMKSMKIITMMRPKKLMTTTTPLLNTTMTMKLIMRRKMNTNLNCVKLSASVTSMAKKTKRPSIKALITSTPTRMANWT